MKFIDNCQEHNFQDKIQIHELWNQQIVKGIPTVSPLRDTNSFLDCGSFGIYIIDSFEEEIIYNSLIEKIKFMFRLEDCLTIIDKKYTDHGKNKIYDISFMQWEEIGKTFDIVTFPNMNERKCHLTTFSMTYEKLEKDELWRYL